MMLPFVFEKEHMQNSLCFSKLFLILFCWTRNKESFVFFKQGGQPQEVFVTVIFGKEEKNSKKFKEISHELVSP